MPGANTFSRSIDRPQAVRPRTPALRIALFSGAYNHIADGVSLTLNRLVRYLEKQGVEVRVFAPTIDEPAVDHAGTLVPVPSVSAPGRPEYRVSLGLTSSVRKELKAFDPTLVHIATPDLLGRSARKWALRHDVPLVSSYHTHFSSYLKYYRMQMLEPLLWRYLRNFYDACEQVYVPSTSMVDVLEEHDIDGDLRLWERGVETDRFSPDQRSLTWRRNAGIADDEIVVSFVGRLVWEKGLDVYAEAVQQLEERGIPHRSMVVGDGPARDELEGRLPNTVFTGYLGGDALPRAYASSDIFFFPSDTETFGNVTLEAMASGLPTVCADATGSNMLVDDGVTGFLVQPGEVDGFRERVERLLTDADLRETMGRAARKRSRHYEWDAILGRLLGYYREVLTPQGDGQMRAGDGLVRTPEDIEVVAS